jgi:bifunctional lysine-specific demethylase and histidyl-hydroxylase NO66
MLDLDWLLHPAAADRFYESVWQTQPTMMATDRPGYFSGLFSKRAVERILEHSQPRHPSIRIASAAQDGSIELPLSPNGRINIDQLRKLYLKGNTLIINSIEDFDPNVAQLARTIEVDMGARVQVNAYLTPPSAQGFRAHYDTHDVLVAQIEGTKRWKVYGADAACPLNELVDGDPRRRLSAAAPHQLNLVSGDVLYIPRGWIHEAMTEKVASLHLTISIHPPLAKDLLQAALDAMVQKLPQLREALPIGPLGAAANLRKLQTHFVRLLELFAAQASLAEATASIDDQMLRRGRTGGDGHLFSDAEKLDTIRAETLLERRSNLPCRVVPIDEGVALQFLNSLVKGPASFEMAMRFVASQATAFAVSDLPGLSAEHQLVFATTLVMDGLCRLCSNSDEIDAKSTDHDPEIAAEWQRAYRSRAM